MFSEGKEVVPTERVVLPWKKDREKKEKKDTAGLLWLYNYEYSALPW